MDIQDCVDDLVYVRELLGKIPTRKEYRQYGKFGSTTLQRKFGSFDAAKITVFGEDGLPKAIMETKPCLTCGKGVTRYSKDFGEKVYCNHSCSAKTTNTIRVSKRVKLLCSYCSKTLSKTKRYYCDGVCKSKHTIQKWKNGEISGSVESGVSSWVRRYLFEKYDSKCVSCGWCSVNPASGKIPLEVEHIDGDYRNNDEGNLTLLCPNCHSLTPTYRALNCGNGRANRRQRYKDGKSF